MGALLNRNKIKTYFYYSRGRVKRNGIEGSYNPINRN